MRTQLAAGAGQFAARALRAVGRACRARGARGPLGALRRVPGWERARDVLRGACGRAWRAGAALGARVTVAAARVPARVILERGAALGAPGGACGCVCPDSSPRGAWRRVAGAGGMSPGEWSGELAGELEGRGGVDRGRGSRGAAGGRARGSARGARRGATGRARRGGSGAPEYRTGPDLTRSRMGCCRGDNNGCGHPDKNPVVVTLTRTQPAPLSGSPRLSSDSTVAALPPTPRHPDAAGGTLLAMAHGRRA